MTLDIDGMRRNRLVVMRADRLSLARGGREPHISRAHILPTSRSVRGCVARPHRALSGHARVVPNSLLDDSEVPLARFGDQLRVDEEIGGLEIDSLEHLAPHHLERAIDIPDPDPEQDTDHPVVHPGENASKDRVITIDTETERDVGSAHERKEVTKLAHVELKIGIRVEDQVPASFMEPCAKSGAIAAILRKRHQSNPRIRRR